MSEAHLVSRQPVVDYVREETGFAISACGTVIARRVAEEDLVEVINIANSAARSAIEAGKNPSCAAAKAIDKFYFARHENRSG